MALSQAQKIDIIVKIKQKVPIKDVAAEYGLHRTTIYRIYKTYLETGGIGRKAYKRGKAIDEETIERLRQYVLSNPFNKLKEIKRDLNLVVHETTICKYLKNIGLRSRVSPKKFLVPNIHVETRLEVARLRRHWTVDFWRQVVFTDESGIDNSGKHFRRVRRPLGTRFDQQYIYRHQNTTIKRVNFFSHISKYGVGKLCYYKTMNAEVYCEVITDLIRDLRQKFNGENFLIVHDNAPFATSQYTERFLELTEFKKYFLEIPKYSPDFNVIENCWAMLKREVNDEIFVRGQPREREQLVEIIERKWQSLPVQYIDTLYHSLPRRMRDVIRCNGSLCRY